MQNLDLIRENEKYRMSDEVACKLKEISPRTIDRLLCKPKQRMKIHGGELGCEGDRPRFTRG
jgi:hypothetical protein